MAKDKDLSDKEKSDAINKVLGEPIFDGFTENVYRIRRNLLAFAVVSIIVVNFNLSINDTNLPITGLSNNNLYWMLGIITLYHLIHFWVYVAQYWSQWQVRLTGKRLLFQTKPAGVFNDKNDEDREIDTHPSQTTLYSWWKHNKDFATSSEITLLRMEELLKSGYVEERLKRFDEEFWKLQRKQHFNWVVFEVAIPIILGIAALIQLAAKVLL